ncbi:MAG: LysR family transcriptional regulator [Brachymonas sp.]|nr:LysR family transcriptional regulator [Brachymonas sp.]
MNTKKIPTRSVPKLEALAARLDLNLLQALDALLAEGNVTRAAQRLHISQPALSSQLARLRAVFGDPLLTPIQRGMQPTALGLELQTPLRKALDQVREVITQTLDFEPSKAKMTLHLAGSDYVEYALFMRYITHVQNLAPGIRIALHKLDGLALERQMQAGDIDLAVMNPRNAPASLRSRHLWDERYACIVRKGHPKVKKNMTLDLLASLEHVVVSPRGGGFTGATDTALAAHGKKRRVPVSAASFLWMPEMIERSDKVALVPERLVHDRQDRLLVLKPPLPIEGFSVSMLWHERTHAHKAHQWLREQILIVSQQT